MHINARALLALDLCASLHFHTVHLIPSSSRIKTDKIFSKYCEIKMNQCHGLLQNCRSHTAAVQSGRGKKKGLLMRSPSAAAVLWRHRSWPSECPAPSASGGQADELWMSRRYATCQTAARLGVHVCVAFSCKTSARRRLSGPRTSGSAESGEGHVLVMSWSYTTGL